MKQKKGGYIMRTTKFFLTVAILSLILTVGCGNGDSNALFVQVEAAQGSAAPGNRAPANFLVVVTECQSGAPVTNLVQSNFDVINHFSVPGQKCGFTNNITAFKNVGTGAYRIQVELSGNIPDCTWVKGDSLTQVIVSSGVKKGQGTATLSIK
ncbi:MAG: hypothetical protein JSV88_17605 [Candidatus Aminicenantes bacterium]|nr:MAG: hypothetical protein JSV88_17605 [Candidatus Aminicenantes bacterium]